MFFLSQINLSPDDNNNAMKKHFYCPATVRVRDLKKIIRLKYNLENDNEVSTFSGFLKVEKLGTFIFEFTVTIDFVLFVLPSIFIAY